MTSAVAAPTAPLLTRFATPRQPGQDIPGQYSERQRMWVVEGASGDTPLIATESALAEITTKTKVEVESDDTRDIAALQLVTKTEVQAERDDASHLAASVLALQTKTMVNTEQDRQDAGPLFGEAYEPTGGLAATLGHGEDLSIPLAVRLRH